MATRSLRDYRLELLWAVFAAANVVVMVVVRDAETIPYHFVWISFTGLYALRTWSLRLTGSLLLAVVASTGIALVIDVRAGEISWQETTELPLMAALFLVTAWHTRRLQGVTAQLRRAIAAEVARREQQWDLLCDVSHQMRARIGVARGQAELLNSNVSAARNAELATKLLQELVSLSAVTSRMLELERITPDVLARQLIDASDFVADVVSRWTETTPRAWAVNVDGPLLLSIDVARMQAALDALLENATAFTDINDRITVGCRDVGGAVELFVTDSGCGMPPDVLRRVWDRLFTTRKSSRSGGNGLGLAIVKAVVEAHGGAVSAESIEGAGSRFGLVLPVAQPPKPNACDRSAAEPSQQSAPISSRWTADAAIDDDDSFVVLPD